MLNLNNLIQIAFKKGLFQVLQEYYQPNEKYIERIEEKIVNEKDYEAIMKIVMSSYEAGFMKAIQEHKKLLEQHGIQVKIVGGKNQADNPK